MNRFAFVFVFALPTAALGQVVGEVVSGQADRDVLLEFFSATGGQSWTDNSGWGTSLPLAEWYGVTTVRELNPSRSDDRVAQLRLRGNNLHGVFPASLNRLAALYLLDLRENVYLVGRLRPRPIASRNPSRAGSVRGRGGAGSRDNAARAEQAANAGSPDRQRVTPSPCGRRSVAKHSYSVRKAIIGSSRAARRAGIAVAASAARTTAAADAANVAGS